MSQLLKPRTKWDRFWAGEFPFEVALGFGAVAVTVINGVKSAAEVPPKWAFAASYFAAGAVTLIVLIVRAVARNRKAQGESEFHALDGALHLLHAILTENQTQFSEHNLRICVFVPHPAKTDVVHQLTDYVGEDRPHGRGRDLSARCGVVGQAFRTGNAKYAKLPKNTDLVEFLVSTFSFDRHEAAGMRRDRRSWAAIPIGSPGQVVAVLYLDSAERDFFGNGNQPRRKSIEAATVGVAKFLSRF